MGVLSAIKSFFFPAPQPSSDEAEAIVEQLIELGFLKFVPASEKTTIREQLVDNVRRHYLGSDWDDECNSADRRNYQADNEDLAEGDVGRVLLRMKGVLTQEGVTLESVEDDFGQERYRIVINGTLHLIYDYSSSPQEDWWTLATKRLLEIVDSLQEDAGSHERLFAINGGNDGRVILLTPEMHNLLRKNQHIFDDDWMPRPAADIGIDQ
jgi:hypothetical protein